LTVRPLRSGQEVTKAQPLSLQAQENAHSAELLGKLIIGQRRAAQTIQD
jgi:hypothetical protein